MKNSGSMKISLAWLYRLYIKWPIFRDPFGSGRQDCFSTAQVIEQAKGPRQFYLICLAGLAQTWEI